MNIAACFITMGDEELEHLKKSVMSVSPFVQSVHILANHEHEKTKAWCTMHGFDFAYLKWNDDFSEQRNASFAMAPKDVDYIYWQDSDDILIGGNKLQEVAEIAKKKNLDAVKFTYWYSVKMAEGPYQGLKSVEDVEISQQRERLLNPRHMKWRKRLHETPVEIEGVSFNHADYIYDEKTSPMVVLHTGANRDESLEVRAKRNERNARILELELADERKAGSPDPRTILYLMKILAESDDPKVLERCIMLGEEYMPRSGWDQERSICRTLQGRCYQTLGLLDDAERMYEEAIHEFRFLANPHIRLAHVLCAKKKYKEADHVMSGVLAMEERKDDAIDNSLENRTLSLEVLLKLHWEWDVKHSAQKAAKLARQLVELNPHPQNEEFATMLEDVADLDTACGHVDHLVQYIASLGDKGAVNRLLQSLPQAISVQPFAVKHAHRYGKPKIWKDFEIAYVANFGQKSLEQWTPDNLEQGIGGSETAVIQLSKEWAKLGYHVTVYGDPPKVQNYDGVLYVPWYFFNPKDKFSTLIQWRGTGLAKHVSAKRFYVDLHDVTHPEAVLPDIDQIDKILVKSKAHRQLLYSIPDEKIVIIPNGVA